MEEAHRLDKASALGPCLTAVRRAIHRHPELGFQEFETATLVAENLTELGIRVDTKVGGTGVIGYLGEGPPVIALRADMDALPIQEESNLPYASQIPGVMHACGHDAHVACLLGAAMLLSRADLPGQVRFLFQPCEEGKDAEGKSGAQRLIEAGAMEAVGAVVGLHVFTNAPLGTIEIGPGPLMAAVDDFDLVVLGQSAHGADPYKGVDAIVLAAHVLTAMQTIVARRIPAIEAGVITVGTIGGGLRRNILAECVRLGGTVRSFNPQAREKLLAELERTCGLAASLGGKYRLDIVPHVPPVVNDSDMTLLVQQVGRELLGDEDVRPAQPEMGGEDFAFLLQHAPGAYFRLGVATPGQPLRRAHSPTFDLDERALPIGAAVLAETASRWLAHNSDPEGRISRPGLPRSLPKAG
jgi:amidohydrolase